MIEAVFRLNSVRRLFFPLRSRPIQAEPGCGPIRARARESSGDRLVSSGESYYRFETVDGCLIITLLPELNDKQWADIEKVGTEIVDRLSTAQSPRFIVDLTPLSYMGSAMVALIVRLYKTVNGRNGQMVVVNQHELVFEVLKLAGLTKLWTIVDSRDKAFAALGVNGAPPSADGGPSPQRGQCASCWRASSARSGRSSAWRCSFPRKPLVSRKVALLIEVAFAALGMVVGTMILVNQTGARRNMGIVLLAICVIVVLGGIVAGPEQGGTPAPGAGGTRHVFDWRLRESGLRHSRRSPQRIRRMPTTPGSAPAATQESADRQPEPFENARTSDSAGDHEIATRRPLKSVFRSGAVRAIAQRRRPKLHDCDFADRRRLTREIVKGLT